MQNKALLKKTLPNDLLWLEIPDWRENGVIAGFSTRQGGFSKGAYTSLNISFLVGDQDNSVLENRQRLARAMELPLERWVVASQVHGTRVEIVDAASLGRGAFKPDDAVPNCDGLITRTSGVVLMAHFGDCVPLLFRARQSGAVGVVHAGWRGTVAGIAQKAVVAFEQRLGIQKTDLEVAIGPSIGLCCYKVGEEVNRGLAKLLGRQAEDVIVSSKEGSRVDLARANALALLNSGLSPSQVNLFSDCTCCNTDLFFSHRHAGGPAGRFAALISSM